MRISRLGLPFILLALITICLLMLTFPQSSWDAAVRGLSIWWDVLFPSLFPFFVISEVLLGFGIVHFLGKLLDPFMRPAFRIPGSGGFVAAMGFAAGYPVSARLTVKLREQKLISRVEGERLVSFTTSSDPIFLIGAVSVGFFHNPRIAGVLALAHYGGSVVIGLFMRFYKRRDQEQPASGTSGTTGTGPASMNSSTPAEIRRVPRLKAALLAMHEARIADGRELGQLLSQAILTSLRLMTVVGGLVVFFSVFLEILSASGAMAVLYEGLQRLLPLLGLPSSLAEPFMSGIFEVTLGAKNAAAAPDGVPLAYKAAAAAFILSWGGLSVHAQVASILNATDLRYTPFLVARSIHAVLSALLLLLLWPFFGPDSSRADTAFAGWGGRNASYAWQASAGNLGYGIKLIAVMLILSILVILIQKFRTRRLARRPKR
ncbi:sporulation integral membrane protein YlbJ [Paenibacillus pinistramenti]|uniref:sporulation integral membrane protein YlbJ n=1 Tax=Paenibacillus pinistramenti TaxID=1768003 RepID=UPI001107F7BD|nr:sporulation integral membrane protein YlbJ [Paenibacillus pinistramenti]